MENNITILNSVREVLPITYQDRIPQANKNNIASIYQTLLDIQPLRNAFAECLITQIMLQTISSSQFENVLSELKKEPMRYGEREEEIYINMAKGYSFNQWASAADVFKYYKSNVMAAYHRSSPILQYAVTVTFDNLRNAFTSEYGINQMINKKIEALMSGANYDEYLQMRGLIDSAYAAKQIFPIKVNEVTNEESGIALTRLIQMYARKFQFPAPQFNIAGSDATSSMSELYILTTPEVESVLNVEVLGYMFNEGRGDTTKFAKTIVVDKFENPALQAALFDRRFFNVRENFRQMTEQKNSAALNWNYWLTISNMYSYSPFYPIVVFTTENIGVDTIVVTNDEATPGSEVELKCVVTDAAGSAPYVPDVVDWSVSGNTSAFTNVLPGSNILIIAQDETADSLTVTATSRYNKTVTGNGTITLS